MIKRCKFMKIKLFSVKLLSILLQEFCLHFLLKNCTGNITDTFKGAQIGCGVAKLILDKIKEDNSYIGSLSV